MSSVATTVEVQSEEQSPRLLKRQRTITGEGDLSYLANGIPLYPLPDPQSRGAAVPHAPVFQVKLTPGEKKLALRNALRYFPAEFHSVLAPEFAPVFTVFEHGSDRIGQRVGFSRLEWLGRISLVLDEFEEIAESRRDHRSGVAARLVERTAAAAGRGVRVCCGVEGPFGCGAFHAAIPWRAGRDEHAARFQLPLYRTGGDRRSGNAL